MPDDVIDLSSSPVAPPRTATISRAAPAVNFSIPASNNPASKLPRSTIFAGKSFYFSGTFATMSCDQAKELCQVNGGIVNLVVFARTDYVVIGSKGTKEKEEKLKAHGARLLTELDFLTMVLSQGNSDKENAAASSSGAHKRPLEDPSPGPSKSSKSRKSNSGAAAHDESDVKLPELKWVGYFAADGEIQLKGKTLIGYDCGGEVYRAQRGKSIAHLLVKFDKWLEECKGEYHNYL